MKPEHGLRHAKAMDAGDYIAIAALVASIFTGGASAMYARSALRKSDESLVNARTATAMARESARAATEAEHRANKPQFELSLSEWDHQMLFHVQILSASAPLTIAVKVQGEAYYDHSFSQEVALESTLREAMVGNDCDYLELPIAWRINEPHIAGRFEGLSVVVELRCKDSRRQWADEPAWSHFESLQYGYTPEPWN